MSVTIAGIDFEHHRYDERGDVLYLSTARPVSYTHLTLPTTPYV